MTIDLSSPPPTLKDIQAAAARLANKAIETPLLESLKINEALGFRLLVKAEPLQRTGSFKFRGAYNRISLIPGNALPGGVVAWSSGNHAQGVAAAAAVFGIPAVIVMPNDTPAVKIRNTRELGGEIVFYDRYRESREEIGSKIAKERGATIVPPYDDVGVIAGQGTVGLEISQQTARAGFQPDAVVVCCGGGGLTAGTAIALAALTPATRVFAAEPIGFDDTGRSLACGERVRNETNARSFCDAILTPTPGEITFPINRSLLAGGVSVTDEEVAEAMRMAFDRLKLIIEPGGAVALAAVLARRLPQNVSTVVAVASGGNVDMAVFRDVLAGGLA